MKQANDEKKTGAAHKAATILGAILCVILLPVLIINITLIIRSLVHQDEVPSVGGIFPLIVLTDSMYPEIQSGDLIICRTEEPENIGDVIAFFDPAGNGSSIVPTLWQRSHRSTGRRRGSPGALPTAPTTPCRCRQRIW